MTPTTSQQSKENPVWAGRPSQLVNFFPYLLNLLLFVCLLLIYAFIWSSYDMAAFPPFTKPVAISIVCLPLLHIFRLWLKVRCEEKVVTTKRIKIRKGIFNSGMRPVQLFRVKDTDYDEPWYWKLFGLGNVTLDTSDHSDPKVFIRAVRNARGLHDQIEQLVVQERRHQGVQEVDYIR